MPYLLRAGPIRHHQVSSPLKEWRGAMAASHTATAAATAAAAAAAGVGWNCWCTFAASDLCPHICCCGRTLAAGSSSTCTRADWLWRLEHTILLLLPLLLVWACACGATA
jgi:hypothetical protein